MDKKTRRHSIIGHTVFGLVALSLLAWQRSHADMDYEMVAKSFHLPILGLRVPFLSYPDVDTDVEIPEKPTVDHSNPLIKVLLFEGESVRFVSIEGVSRLTVAGRPATGRVAFTVHNGKVMARQGKTTLAFRSAVAVAAPNDGPVVLRRGWGDVRRTDGQLRISVKKGRLKIVNTLDLETYLLAVAEPELGSFHVPAEALKAQLIASRSYILAMRHAHPKEDFDFCDGVHCQLYRKPAKYPAEYLRIAASVRGQYLTYKGHPAAAFFHHNCGGMTAAVEDVWPVQAVPYLRRVNDGPGVADCSYDGKASWAFTINRKALRICLARAGWIKGKEALDSLRVVRTDPTGRAREILVESSRPRWISADHLRHVINQYCGREVLLSTLFTITPQGNSFRFQGKGWGHGVGMCQSGALYMARHGKSYKQILAHYYPGTQLSELKRP